MPVVVSFIGPRNSGKTTLIEALLPLLRGRGLRVGVLKHTHCSFETDREGKDTWRYRAAGADAVAIAGPDRVAFVAGCERRWEAARLAERFFADVDVLLAEAVRESGWPQVVVVGERGADPRDDLRGPDVVAVVGRVPEGCVHPAFAPGDLRGLAEYLIGRLGIAPRRGPGRP